jgi:hypothetical protein
VANVPLFLTKSVLYFFSVSFGTKLMNES